MKAMSCKLWAWLVAAWCVGVAEGRALEPKSQWVRARTDYVEVLSDASQSEASEYALQYSAFRHVFAEMIGGAARELPPTVILLFRSRRTFDTYFPQRDEKAGELVSVSNVIDGMPVQAHVLNHSRQRTLRMAYEFEATWALSRLGLGLPVWAGQGTGKVFSTVKLEKGVCVLGDYQAMSLNTWLDSPMPWARFFEINTMSPEYRDRLWMSVYHSQAWAFMHYLWLKDDQGAERFAELVRRLRTEPPMAVALALAGVPEAELKRTLSRYVGRIGRVREFTVDEGAWRAQMQTGAAERAVVGVHLADLLRGFVRPGLAELELAEARAAAPEHPLVREGLAREALARGDREAALALYREAMERKSTNVAAHLASASDWLDQGAGGSEEAGGGGNIAETAIAELRRALEIDPRNEDAYRLLGRALYLRPRIEQADLELLAPSIPLPDTKGLIRYYRALVLGRLQQTAEAHETLAALSVSPTVQADVREQATNRLGQEAFNSLLDRVEKLAGEGKFAEARASAEAARKGPLRAETFQPRLDNVDKWIAATEQQRARK